MLLARSRALRRLAAAQPLPPELTQPVNDFAHVIDRAERSASWISAIRSLKPPAATSSWSPPSTTFAPYADIHEYAVKMFENRGRGIGEKGKDNGLLVLVAVKDRRVRIEVGYDLEQFITDGYAGEISREVMAPAFAAASTARGLSPASRSSSARIAEGAA